MADSIDLQVGKFLSRVKNLVLSAAKPNVMRELGNEAIRIIVKRTRLGYGADPKTIGARIKFPSHKPSYVEFRQKNRAFLSPLTKPKRSNLTLSGQLLDSMKIKSIKARSAVIGPSGGRSGRFAGNLNNEQLASVLAKQGRTFNNLTIPEVKQLARFYRTRFGDLRRSSGV